MQVSGDLTPGTPGQDSDADGDTLLVTQFVVGGMTVFVTPVTPGTISLTEGDLTINSDGSFTLDPAQDFNGSIPQIEYTISDGNGGTDTAFLDIEIIAVNDVPVAVDDGPFAVTEDTPAMGNVLTNPFGLDSDADGHTLMVTEFTVPGAPGPIAAGGTATIPGVGTLTIAANGDFIFMPTLNYNGPVPTATYTVSDGNGGMDTAALSFADVTPDNAPPAAMPDAVTIDEDTQATGNVLTNDDDVENDMLLVTGATVDSNGNGTPDLLAIGKLEILL